MDITLPLLRIRNFTLADITEEYLSWLNNPSAVKFSNQRFLRHGYLSSIRYLFRIRSSGNSFLLIKSHENIPLGTATVYRSIHHNTCDIGILISPHYQGLGYGKVAFKAIVEHLLFKEAVRKVTAGTLSCNHPMISLMLNAGMTHEATLHNQELLDDLPRDIVIYSRFRL